MKEEFPPLYVPGMHDISIGDINRIFLDSFDVKDRRTFLIGRFQAFMNRFRKLRIPAEIWIDGSFSTLKPEPNDIDMVIFLNETDVNQLSPANMGILEDLFNENIAISRYSIHLFCVPSSNVTRRHYFEEKFGFSEINKTPKGIPRIYHGVS